MVVEFWPPVEVGIWLEAWSILRRVGVGGKDPSKLGNVSWRYVEVEKRSFRGLEDCGGDGYPVEPLR